MSKSAKIVYLFLVANLSVLGALSQNLIFPPGQIQQSRTRAILVPMGDNSLIPTPSDDSERIKFSIKTERDSAFYSLKTDRIEKGIIVVDNSNGIVSKTKVFKGNLAVFEMVPDVISNPKVMTLYTYMPGGAISFKYLFNENNKQIKYKKFELADQLKNTLISLILCYIDDDRNNTENLLKKYTKDDLIYITSEDELQEKILKHINKGLLVYYTLNDKPV